MLPILRIGPMALPTNGVLIILTIWFAVWLSERHSFHYQIEEKKLDSLILLSVIIGLVSSRIFYVLRFPELFIEKPVDVFSLNIQMLDIWGGLLAGAFFFVILAQKRNLPIWDLLDSLSSMIPVLGVGLGLASLADGSLYGVETNLPWGIYLWGAERHPVQFYQFAGSSLILLAYFAIVSGYEKNKLKSNSGFCILGDVEHGSGFADPCGCFQRRDTNTWRAPYCSIDLIRSSDSVFFQD